MTEHQRLVAAIELVAALFFAVAAAYVLRHAYIMHKVLSAEPLFFFADAIMSGPLFVAGGLLAFGCLIFLADALLRLNNRPGMFEQMRLRRRPW